MRTLAGRMAWALPVAAAALLAGCANPSTAAGGGAGSGAGSGSGSASAAPSGAGTRLTVTADAGAGAAPVTWVLVCDPPAGTHPKAAAACAQLAAAHGDPFAPTPAGMMCAMIYGGPQQVHVEGTYKGRRVDTVFARANGCEVARWERVSDLLVITGGAGLQP